MEFWERMATSDAPIVIYGTGNGADMFLDEADARGIRVNGCFASDGFVRSRTFRGFKVLSYNDARHIFGKMFVVLCFGTHDPLVIANIQRIAQENELYMPDLVRDDESNLFDLKYCQKQKEEIEFAYSLLADDISRKSFMSIIDYRITGDISYLLEDQVDDISAWEELSYDQDEVFIDCGAYNGDTIARFRSIVSSYEAIYGIEPDRKTFKKLERATEGLDNLKLYNAFVSDHVGSIPFVSGKGRGSTYSATGDLIDVVTVDSILKGSRATLIKYDTEGFEKEALNGSYETICNHKPKLIVSAYHKIQDLFTLPRQIYEMRHDYTFKLRKSKSIPYWDSCYYIY